jgi:hypothetical protein
MGYFGCSQDISKYQNQGQILSDDARWSAYYDEQPASFKAYLPIPNS